MSVPTDLEASLAALAAELDAPGGEGLGPAVVARLRVEAVPGSPLAAPWWRGRRPKVLLAVGAILTGIAGAVAGPAVADWLGVRGVEVRRTDRVAPTTSAPRVAPGAVLDLGEAVSSLAAAEASAGFAALVPSSLGHPDAIWVDRRGAAPFISLVYLDGPLVTEFDATLAADAVVSKTAGPDAVVEQLRVDGAPALWIDGVHTVAVRARDGDHVFERLRLSDRVLLVQRGSLTVRIEVPEGLGRDDAVRIAESLRRGT